MNEISVREKYRLGSFFAMLLVIAGFALTHFSNKYESSIEFESKYFSPYDAYIDAIAGDKLALDSLVKDADIPDTPVIRSLLASAYSSLENTSERDKVILKAVDELSYRDLITFFRFRAWIADTSGESFSNMSDDDQKTVISCIKISKLPYKETIEPNPACKMDNQLKNDNKPMDNDLKTWFLGLFSD